MLHDSTSQPSSASITPEIIIASVVTVGLETSSLSIHFHCGLPFAQYLAMILPSFFSVRNISDSNALLHSVSM